MAPPDRTCPVCRRSGAASIVRRGRLPAMQNYVYRHLDEARRAKGGAFDLALCPHCGFARNAAFDPSLLDYDQGYDNRVPSAVMDAHYRSIAAALDARFGAGSGLILDVGCGKGAFLETFCALFPGARGLGIDPSHEGEETAADGRIRYVRAFFSETHVRERPGVVVCRHVLEHIPDPVAFLRAIRAALRGFPGVPLVFEVPETAWILRNDAFWDFCYEHCNYFTTESLANALRAAGLSPGRSWTSYGDQYLSMEATVNPDAPDPLEPPPPASLAEFSAYAEGEAGRIGRIQEVFAGLARAGRAVAVWGMATKGVVFSFLTDPDASRIGFCIDVNPNKQGCFVPLTGHRIEAPEALRRAGGPLAILVMNPNYLAEIRAACAGLGLSPTFLDAHGGPL